MRSSKLVNLYRWYDEYVRSARIRGDETAQQLGELYYLIANTKNNDQAKVHCDQAIKIAKALDEPYWELYFRVMSYDVSPDNGYITDELIQMSVDVSQPRFEGCPFSGKIYQALLHAYSLKDPLGHATDILEGADYVEQNVSMDQDIYISLSMYRLRVYLARREWLQAYQEATEYQNRAQELANNYHTLRSTLRLTETLYYIGNYHLALETLSHTAAPLTRMSNPSWDKTVLYWYRLLYKQLGDQSNYERIVKKIESMSNVPSYDYLSGRAKLDYLKLDHLYMDLLSGLLKMRNLFEFEKYRHLQIDLQLEYLLYLDQGPIWKRMLHYGTNSTVGNIFGLPMVLAESIKILFVVAMPIYLVGSLLAGTVIEITGAERRKTIHDIQDAVATSPAKDIYEQRLLRIQSGDYTQLS